MAIIQAYGLFWRADEVDWNPGKGNKDRFCLLGRRGANKSKLQVVNFRTQRGLYILYGNYGPYYVGLTRKQALGKRLKDHLFDDHKGNWDRFSWFGFCQVLKGRDPITGFQKTKQLPQGKGVRSEIAIGDMEALLIRAMALENIAQMNFANGVEWTQIKRSDEAMYRARAKDR